MATILIIEDDAQIRKFLRISLEANDFTVFEARLGEMGLSMCSEINPDLVILDLGLPDLDGRELIRRIREWSAVPVIVLSVRSDGDEKVALLDAGANDYVTKPFNITELMARIRVLLRSPTASGQGDSVLLFGTLSVDLAKRRVHQDGIEVAVSRKEYELLRCLASHAGEVLTHEEILQEIWGPSHLGDIHYLRVLVGHLRQKLRDEPSKPHYVHTVQGIGYRFATSSEITAKS
ncbi:MAG: response regulator [Woeseiaceae bacterium]